MMEAAIAESRKLAAQVVAAPALAQELEEQRKVGLCGMAVSCS